MRRFFLFLGLLSILFCPLLSARLKESKQKFDGDNGDKGFIIGEVFCQLGNNLFQVATASALAWDNRAEAHFPNIQGDPLHHQHIFSRCNISQPEGVISKIWEEPSHQFHPISFTANMKLVGYFQSEKYFVNQREKILNLFEPCADDVEYIMQKYGHLLTSEKTVGIHVRWYFEDGIGKVFIQYGKDYLKKALSLFPKDSIYIVCSNNPEFARKNIPESTKNVFFIENEPDYIDLYILSLCKHNIITNSTFGWWGAWLNKNPAKKVVAPYDWLHPINGPPTKGVVPKSWKKIKAKWGPSPLPETYQ